MEGRPIWCPLSVLNYQRKESTGISCNKIVRNLSRTNTFGVFFRNRIEAKDVQLFISPIFQWWCDFCFRVQHSIQHSIQLVPSLNDNGSSPQTQKLKAGCPLHALVNGLSWQGRCWQPAGHFDEAHEEVAYSKHKGRKVIFIIISVGLFLAFSAMRWPHWRWMKHQINPIKRNKQVLLRR